MLSKMSKLAYAFQQTPNKGYWLREEIKWRYFTYKERAYHRENLAFDEMHQVETANKLTLDQAGISGDRVRAGNGVYRPVTQGLFNAAVNAVPISHKAYSFVDVGSGKGKVLLMASDYPFRRIVGVEYSPVLHEAAVANLASYVSSTQNCRDITSVLGDALTFGPPAGPLLFFVFNALAPDLMERWLQSVEGLIASDESRPVVIVYTNLRSVSELGGILDGRANLRPICRTRQYVVLINRAANNTSN